MILYLDGAIQIQAQDDNMFDRTWERIVGESIFSRQVQLLNFYGRKLLGP